MSTWLIDHLPSIVLYSFFGAVACFAWAVVESLGPTRRAMTPATSGLMVCAFIFVIAMAAFPFASAVKQQSRVERLEKIVKDQSRAPNAGVVVLTYPEPPAR